MERHQGIRSNAGRIHTLADLKPDAPLPARPFISRPKDFSSEIARSSDVQQTRYSLCNGFKESRINEQAVRSLRRNGTSARDPLSSFIQPSAIRYTPYATVEKADVRKALYDIARDFQMIDAWFADFYRVAVPHNDLVSSEFEKIHEKLRSGTSDGQDHLGTLGQYLERVVGMKKRNPGKIPEEIFIPLYSGNRALEYLQDGVDIPYWILLRDIFLPYCESGDLDNAAKFATIRIIKSVQVATRARLQKLGTDYSYELPKDIMDGIQCRLSILENMTESIPSDYCDESAPVKPAGGEGPGDTDKIGYSALFIFVFAVAMIPACLGIDRAASREQGESPTVGSTLDADFMWLIAGNLLALLGNIFAIQPRWRLTRDSLARIITQALILLSVALGIASIALYCFVTKAWSSLMAFFSNLFAIAAVYFSTLHVSTRTFAGATTGLGVKMKKL